MKLCDVVLNSVWHDPRVTKQLDEYSKYGVELSCVGMLDQRHDEHRVKNLPCPVYLVERDRVFGGKQKNIIKKIIRELYRIYSVTKEIVAQKPEIIHANDLDALIPSYFAKKILKCVLVFDAHELNAENRYYDKYPLHAWVMRKIERYIVKRCDLMVCVSNAAADYYSQTYKIERPLVITNCISRDNILKEIPDKHAGFEILNHGMYRDARGFELMIDSCDLLQDYPDVKLAFRGMGPLEKELRENAAKQENQNLIFYPPVLPKDMIKEAAASCVGVAITLPVCLNYVMSVSNRLFEYAAAGLPVIMSDIPEHRYLNDKYQFGIVIPDNRPETFAQAAIQLYTDKELYNRCAENARKLSEEINWENEFSRLIQYERKLIG